MAIIIPLKLNDGRTLNIIPMGYAGNRDRCPKCHEDDERWLYRSIDDRPWIECMRCGCVYNPLAKNEVRETQCDCVIETQSCPECRAAAAAQYPGKELPF